MEHTGGGVGPALVPRAAEDHEERTCPAFTLKWAERYCRAERDLAEAMFGDLEQVWRECGAEP